MTRRDFQKITHARLKIASLQDELKKHKSVVRSISRKCDHKLPSGESAWQRNGKMYIGNRVIECCVCRKTEVS